MKSRIMYIECKAGGLTGPARIGRVTFSKTGKTIYYRGRAFQSLKGAGFNRTSMTLRRAKPTGSPDRTRTVQTAYGERDGVEIDPEVRLEYWRDIRGIPERRDDSRT